MATGGSPIQTWLLNQLETIKKFHLEVAQWPLPAELDQTVKDKLIATFGPQIASLDSTSS